MANTFNTFEGNGLRTVFPVDFSLGYLRRDDIKVYTGAHTEFNENALSFVWLSDTQIELEVPVELGTEFFIRRIVERDKAINDYEEGAILRESNLDASFAQALMILEELADGFFDPLNDTGFGGTGTYTPTEDLDMNGFNILNANDVEANRFLHSRVGDLVEYINERTANLNNGIRTDILINEDGLVVNAFHDTLGRQGYFPSEAGTSEGQFILIRAALLAYKATGDYKWLAIADKVSSNVDKLYLGEPPENPNELYIPHWLFVVKKAVEMQSADLAYEVTMLKDENNEVYVGFVPPENTLVEKEQPVQGETPITDGDDDTITLPPLTRIELDDLFPDFGSLDGSNGNTDTIGGDADAPIAQSVSVQSTSTTTQTGFGDRVINVVRAYSKDSDTRLDFDNPFAGVIGTDYGTPSEVVTNENGTIFRIPVSQFPADTPNSITVKTILIYDFGEEVGVSENIEAWPYWRRLEDTEISCAVDTLPWAYEAFQYLEEETEEAKWTNAKLATEANVYRVFEVDDGRPWIKPTGGNPVDLSGAYFFSSRDGFTKESVTRLENLTTRVEIPAGAGEAQYGRGVKDEVKAQDTGVLLDWKVENLGNSVIRVFIQKGQSESTATRYYYDVDSSNLANDFDGELIIPLGDFVPHKLNSLGWFEVIDPIVDLQKTDVVGFVVETPDAVNFEVRRFRPIPEIQLPYTPHVAPFTANALNGQIIDWRGSAGIGYQDPVIWAKLGNTAGLSGMLQFLEDSQAEYASRYTDDGLFMPAYVWDRFDKQSVTDAASDTWTFDWVDPNTEWVGYSARCVAACAEAGDIVATTDPTNANRAFTISNKFMTLIRNTWTDANRYPPTNFPESIPELKESTYYEKGDRVSPYDGFMYEALSSGTTSNIAVDYPNENIGDTIVNGTVAFKFIGYTYTQSPVYGNYEEPHAVALFMRAACYLYRNGIDTASNLAFIEQGWNYLERLWADAQNYNALRGTWSGNPEAGEYFGFWTGEIVTILSKLNGEFSDIRDLANIPSGTIDSRLKEHADWVIAATRGGLAYSGVKALNTMLNRLEDAHDVDVDSIRTRLTALEAGGGGSNITAAEVKTLYESNADTNAFTDSEKTKLANIDGSATGDMSDAEVKAAYERNANTNAFTDADAAAIDSLGSAATKNVGTALGDVMEVGAGGLLSNGVSVTDMNNISVGSKFIAASPNTLNLPTSAGTNNWAGIHAERFSTTFFEVLAGLTENRFFGRTFNNGYRDWVEFYTSGNTGNVVTRDVGTDAGDVMEVGAFGVGGVATSTQLDLDAGDYIEAGMTILSAPVADLVNGPVDNAGTSRYIVNFAGNLSTGVQTVTNRVSGKSWFRVFSSGVILTDWQEIYHSGNLDPTTIDKSTGKAYVDVTTADQTLDATQSNVPVIQIGGTPSTSRTLTLEPLERMWVITNDSDSGCTLTTGAGGTVFLEAGYQSVVFGDGVGIRQSMTVATNGLKMNGDLILPIYSVASLPDPTTRYMVAVGCTDGDSGSPCLAVSDGGTWKRVALGATVSAT
ncbi:putative long tail fiber protein [Alteromonas phage vB_AspP-H4/4]|uniref:Long tail fiber protein n=1 Tax=Alteromonas phage vB_AspP-H4/4 TaxID=2928692 RepID=A0A220YLA0_9CAUD|nr:tail protein [Alteromonas phage vB_AspP-H4/4]ASL24424.2 putative long tail fiber protein [Alteromonas phage vB_AspP-H4/4]